MKRYVLIGIIICILFNVTGCNKDENPENNIKNDFVKKCEKIDIGMKQSAVEKILSGSDGKYEDGKISITYKEGIVSYISIQLSYNKEEIKSSKTNLSAADSYISKLDENEKFYYSDLVNSFETEGFCLMKTVKGCSNYAWADDKGNYITASLSLYSDGYVMSMLGRL